MPYRKRNLVAGLQNVLLVTMLIITTLTVTSQPCKFGDHTNKTNCYRHLPMECSNPTTGTKLPHS